MEELKKMVGELEEIKANAEDENTVIVSKLQEIGAKLINEYEIKVGPFTIQPLLVEAYYFADEFQDDNLHGEPEQRNNWGKLYFHKKGRGGVDICLSNKEEYALSFLIKCACVNGVICTQISLYDTLIEAKATECVLFPKASIQRVPIIFVPRKNMKETEYKCKKLAMVSLQALNYKSVCQSLQKGKMWALAHYFIEIGKEPDDESVREILGYRSKEVKKMYAQLQEK